MAIFVGGLELLLQAFLNFLRVVLLNTHGNMFASPDVFQKGNQFVLRNLLIEFTGETLF
jgi:hypothetical protein